MRCTNRKPEFWLPVWIIQEVRRVISADQNARRLWERVENVPSPQSPRLFFSHHSSRRFPILCAFLHCLDAWKRLVCKTVTETSPWAYTWWNVYLADRVWWVCRVLVNELTVRKSKAFFIYSWLDECVLKPNVLSSFAAVSWKLEISYKSTNSIGRSRYWLNQGRKHKRKDQSPYMGHTCTNTDKHKRKHKVYTYTKKRKGGNISSLCLGFISVCMESGVCAYA